MENLIELDEQNLRNVDGGIFGLDDVLVGLSIAAGAAIINDWDNFKDGFSTAFI